MSQRVGPWAAYASAITQLWGGTAAASASDEAAFAAYAQRRTALNVHFVAPLIVLAAILWWPLDFVFFDDVDTQARLAAWRICGSAVCLTFFYLFRSVPWAQARPLLVYASLCTGCAVLTGALLSGAGGPGRPFLQGSYLLPWASFVYFGALRGRVLATGLLIGGWLAATLFFHPETLHFPNFANAIGFLLFCGALCVVAGHIIYRLSRNTFLHERMVIAQAAELRDLNAELESRVEARTHDLRALAARLNTVLEDERGRIAREIHDDLGQSLGAIRLEVEVAQAHLARTPGGPTSSLAGSLERLGSLLGETLTTSRRLLSQLRPRLLDDLGLCAAMGWLVDDFRARQGISCALTFEPEALEVDAERSLALFRILQECLTNVSRHAQATKVSIVVGEREDGAVYLHVSDNGVGGAGTRSHRERLAGTSSGVGLVGMRERVAQFDGRLECKSPLGGGTHISVALPRPRALTALRSADAPGPNTEFA